MKRFKRLWSDVISWSIKHSLQCEYFSFAQHPRFRYEWVASFGFSLLEDYQTWVWVKLFHFSFILYFIFFKSCWCQLKYNSINWSLSVDLILLTYLIENTNYLMFFKDLLLYLVSLQILVGQCSMEPMFVFEKLCNVLLYEFYINIW